MRWNTCVSLLIQSSEFDSMEQVEHVLMMHSQNRSCVFAGLSAHFIELSRHDLYQLIGNAFAEVGIVHHAGAFLTDQKEKPSRENGWVHTHFVVI